VSTVSAAGRARHPIISDLPFLLCKYFPRDLLYRLRNEIPLERLIANELNWRRKHREGRFSFVCARCGESLTAVNPRTNLGRCFRYEENFNAIDFVMPAPQREFVDAVHFLGDLLPARASAPHAVAAD
jgi:hypothetical protein